MTQTQIICFLIITYCFSISKVNSQTQDSLKCNISIILETDERINNISEDLMLKFLETFGEDCRNNVEFSEYSNEILFKIMQQEPELFCSVLDKNRNRIEFDEIITELESPINDLINLELTINGIVDTKINSRLKSQIVLAINSANWDESEKIEQLQTPSLVFFYPDSIQFYSIANSEDSEGIYEVSTDFGYYANKIVELFKDSTLMVNMSDKRLFIANNELIDKFDQEFPYGIILVKSNEFKIETGVFTDIDLLQMISEYFKNE